MIYILRIRRVFGAGAYAVCLCLTLGLLPVRLWAQTITTIAGNGSRIFSGDGGPATSAGMWWPVGVAVDNQGNVFIVDSGNNRIRKVDTNGIITTVAGNGTYPNFVDGGPATGSSLYTPTDVAVDTKGNLFISVFNQRRIRKVDANGILTTLAGNGYSGYSGDYGRAVKAMLNAPSSVALDARGNIYFIDQLRVRKIGTDGIITTVIGHGIRGFLGDGGLAINAYLYNPSDIAVDQQGNIYLSDDYRIRKVDTNGIITTIAGNGPRDFSGDGGPAVTAGINGPGGLTVDKQGNLYFFDSGNHRIRKITTDGLISTVAGNGTAGYSGDGGHPLEASISPSYLTLDAQDNLYFSDYSHNRVRKITAASVPLEVTSFSLINPETDQDIRPMAPGEEINLASLPVRTINIRANTSPAAVGSVVMDLSGQQSHRITETVPPYSLFKDTNGDYHTWRPAPGNYTLTATPYTGPNGTGTAGKPLTVNFRVVDAAPAARLTAENSSDPAELRVFPNPFRETFTVELPTQKSGGQSVQLYDLLGRLVWQGVAEGAVQRVDPGQRLGAGAYVLRVGSGANAQHRKIVKTP